MNQLLSDYHYEYPPELIAQEPLSDRSFSRMMVLSVPQRRMVHSSFREFPNRVSPGDLVIVNDTSVLAARLFAKKKTGGRIEIFLINPKANHEWSVWLSPARGLTQGTRLKLFTRQDPSTHPMEIILTSNTEGDYRIQFASRADEKRALNVFGEMPLPPYIKREVPQAEDRERYQTIFAKNPGAVAAPTAGLHFTQEIKKQLRARQVEWATVTLHVGPGTFAPVKTQNINDHAMHREWYHIPEETLAALERCKKRGGKVIAVGTTTLRALESFARDERKSGWTDLYIRPGYRFRIIDALLTNFHQPGSTLLILVSSLAGKALIFEAYGKAIQEKYRLFSYGDCMLIQN